MKSVFNLDRNQKSSPGKLYQKIREEIRKPIILILNFLFFLTGSVYLGVIPDVPVAPCIIMIIYTILATILYKRYNAYYSLIFTILIGLSYAFVMYVRVSPISDVKQYNLLLRGMNLGLFEPVMLLFLSKPHQLIIMEICIWVPKIYYLYQADYVGIIFHLINSFGLIALKLITDRNEKKIFLENIQKQHSLEKFQNLIDHVLPTNFCILDSSVKKMLFINQAMKSMFDYQNDDIILKIFSNIYIEKESRSNLETSTPLPRMNLLDYIYEHNLLNGISEKYFAQMNIESKTIDYSIILFPFEWKGVSSVGVLMTDISHQLEIIKLKKDNENKELAISTVAHELRNPMNGLLGNVELIAQQIQEKSLKKSFDILKTNIQYMLHLLNSILDIQQIKANKLSINVNRTSISEIFQSIQLMFEFQCDVKKISFFTYINPDVPKFMETDKERLSQILINLCANAIKFTSTGSVLLKATISEFGIEFGVKDTGVGMNDEECSNLFKVFGKLKSTSKINKHGVGLGLMISNSLVKILNNNATSQIKIKSKQGEGSYFFFTLPLKYPQNDVDPLTMTIYEEEADIKLQQYSSILKPNISFTGRNDSILYTFTENQNLLSDRTSLSKTVMIVDDNPFNIYVLKQIIRDLGLNTIVAYNGKEALQEFENQIRSNSLTSIIFMDIQMPIMDGLEASQILYKKCSELNIHHVPIVICSGENQIESSKPEFKSSIHGYLQKPVKKSEVISYLKRFSLI